ncbi:MAG TPA: TIGR02587 family membrane protein [Cyanobacteria bacterium UBA8803]|nr:TIGR02587 family membrane protein [Cyanobacteria bacterium UBA9273]HBL57068.1 TIGR02587 family membrane protein [Cyanobacteria bacterium UBA8803]
MVKTIRQHQQSYLWSKELQDILRGISGGFLFGIPLMYTMEVWWIGSHVEPPLLLAALAATYLVVFLLNRTEGFRNRSSGGLRDDAMDSVEALAIGILCTTFMLILLRRITWDTSLDEMLGKVIFESVPFSIGVALSRSLLNGDRVGSNQVQETKPKTASHSQRNKVNVKETMGDISATLIGATIVAFNIAPTDEIPMLAAATSPPWLIAILVSSLLISYNIVFVAGFINQHKRHQQLGLFQTPETETVICYLVSLLASVLMLWFFHQLTFNDPWFLWLRYTLLLGLPATIGGAAGRIAI